LKLYNGKNIHEHPFYLGVQWHPERMVDQNSPLSFNIRQAFLDYIIKHENPSLNDTDEEIESINNNEIENKPPPIQT